MQFRIIALVGIPAMLALLLLSGCPDPDKGPGLPEFMPPAEVAGANGSIGGTLYALTPQTPGGLGQPPQGVLDFPYDGDVILYREDGATLTEVTRTRSHARGTYLLRDVPAGRYTLRATSRTVATQFAPAIDVEGEVRGIAVRPGIPVVMCNLLLGPAGKNVTFHGAVTRAGAAAPGATVCLRITGHDLSWLNNGDEATISMVISTTADAAGQYTISAPQEGISYELSAHDGASLHTWLDAVAVEEADIALQPATAAKFPNFNEMIVFSSTLSAPTAEARSAAGAMRLGLTASTRGSRRALTEARAQWAATREPVLAVGIVENGLYFYDSAWWDPGLNGYVVQPDASVLAYDVARLDSGAVGPYTILGQSVYPEQTYFFDCDARLQVGREYLYSVRSVAAGGLTSRASRPAVAKAMPQIVMSTPNGAALHSGTDSLAWRAVGDAASYAVLIYKALPTLNPEKATSIEVDANTLSVPVDLAPGTYWWGVAAYNSPYFGNATAASFSEFRRFDVL